MTELCSISTARTASPGPQSRARLRYKVVMKLVRRTHLYTGLFLTPWVFLFGVAALQFNHPDAFLDPEAKNVSRSDTVGTSLERFPNAHTLATAVVNALNARAGGGMFRIVEEAGAVYSQPITVTTTGKGREYIVRFDPETGEAIIRSTASIGHRPKGWPSRDRVVLSDPPHAQLADGVPALLAKLGIESKTAAVLRDPPDLEFTVETNALHLRVAYNIQTEHISTQPAEDPGRRLSTRRFLTGLPLAFDHPAPGARWFRAVVVDSWPRSQWSGGAHAC